MSAQLPDKVIERYAKPWRTQLKQFPPAQAVKMKREAGRIVARSHQITKGDFQQKSFDAVQLQRDYGEALQQAMQRHQTRRQREQVRRAAVQKCRYGSGPHANVRNTKASRGDTRTQRKGGQNHRDAGRHGPRAKPCGYSQVSVKCGHCKGQKGSRPADGFRYLAPANVPTMLSFVAAQHGHDKVTIELDDKGTCDANKHPLIIVYGDHVEDPTAPVLGPVTDSARHVIQKARLKKWVASKPKQLVLGRKADIAVSPSQDLIPFLSWFRPDAQYARRYTAVIRACGHGKRPLYGSQFLHLICYPAETTKLQFKLNPGRSKARKQSADFVKGQKVHRLDVREGVGGLLKSNAYKSSLRQESLKETSGTRKGKVGKVSWTTRTKTIKEVQQSHAGGTSKHTREQNAYQKKKKLGGGTTKGKANKTNTSDNIAQKRRGNAATALSTFTLTRGSADKQSTFDMGKITAAIDAIGATTSKLEEAIKGLPKCGWYINWSLVFGEGSFGYECGWKEDSKSGGVYWWWCADVAMTLLKGSVEAGFGFQFSKVQAKVYLAFEAGFSIKGKIESKPPPDHGLATIEVKGSSQGAVGIVAEIGKIISATGKITTGIELVGALEFDRGLKETSIAVKFLGVAGTVNCQILWGAVSRSYVRNPIHPKFAKRTWRTVVFPRLKEKPKKASLAAAK